MPRVHRPEPPAASRGQRPRLDVRAVVILSLAAVAGWLAYGTGNWHAAITAAVAVTALLFAVIT